jgi:predicted ribosome quality control (RQC) complex YloA/Tae2 family protein
VDIATLRAIQVELENTLVGKRLGRLFPLTRFETAADMHLADGRWLFFSIEPASPRIYLIRRRLRDIEKQSGNPSPFLLLLKKRLSNALLTKISVPEEDRVMLLEFDAETELSEPGAIATGFTNETVNHNKLSLVIQLTGRSANIFLLDAEQNILATARESQGAGQTIGERYAPPERRNADTLVRVSAEHEDSLAEENVDAESNIFTSLSDQLDHEHLQHQSEKQFNQLAQNARSKITSEIKRKEKLQKNLEHDLANHGDATRWKHFGDVLLANIGTAKRENDAFLVTDYFDEDQKQIAIPFENNDTPSETAEKYFRRYTKARNALGEIAKRLAETENELKILCERLSKTEEHIAERDIAALESVSSSTVRKGTSSKSRKHTNDERSGYRTFISSDGFEILVGKKAKDNDHLTSRVAKSLDTWMHAADYPGSHVVIRDSGKREVPPQTLLEAAQLAAFYSQGRKQVKAAVHYTQKKFVNKPKGSAPGLVSLASFKTLLVEPKIPDGVQLGGRAAGDF